MIAFYTFPHCTTCVLHSTNFFVNPYSKRKKIVWRKNFLFLFGLFLTQKLTCLSLISKLYQWRMNLESFFYSFLAYKVTKMHQNEELELKISFHFRVFDILFVYIVTQYCLSTKKELSILRGTRNHLFGFFQNCKAIKMFV